MFQCTGKTYENDIIRDDSVDDPDLSREVREKRDKQRELYRRHVL